MKKAANIIFLVSAIVSIVVAVIVAIIAITFLVLSGPAFTPYLAELIEKGIVNVGGPGASSSATPEELAAYAQLVFQITGYSFLPIVVCGTANAVVCFKCRNNNVKGMFIASIVLGALSGVYFNIVSSIFALIKGDTIENKNNNVVENAQ